ncbi:FGGY family carbohydrate kinase [Coraliomargarita sp. SDUM461004]|uniref:FGGY family carbohydrate kinase n=1 Tax=Thalassobacterium sedimentorum TaxID=3041258 RepID=A0ABU1AN74_9BACT|nr:FGGY-family carbohydrate kinase [Coraliomargarita sp. SDUM461004]MDQ8196129.1 FGGY family carbohydrate kinase [Coraliomargarita sp. SDUM461004]
MSTLGLDIGTSGCKAVVFDDCGRQLSSARRNYKVISPQLGQAELDSAAVGDACLSVIKETAGSCSSDPVCSLAISSQGEAFTLLDEKGQVLANAMVSSDQRAVDELDSCPISTEALYRITGHTPHPMFSLFKLLWLRRKRPDILDRARYLLCFEDYIHYRLGLQPAISHSLAARTMLYDVRVQNWSREILDTVGLRMEQLSRPLESGAAVGRLSKSMSETLNLATGTIVVAGGHDQVCAALGSGAVDPGQAALGSGTVECITVTTAEPFIDFKLMQSNLCAYPHTMTDRYATLAYNLTGGNLLQWFRDEWSSREVNAAERSHQDVYELILDGMATQPSSLLVLPYFAASGTPYFDSLTPAAILGLRLATSRGEVLRGLLEGLAFELALNFQILSDVGVSVHELIATGGGARNRAWLQLRSDIFNLPISVPELTEAGCLGCAVLAYAAISDEDPTSLLKRWVRIREVVMPIPENAEFYRTRRDAYLALRPMLRAFEEKHGVISEL